MRLQNELDRITELLAGFSQYISIKNSNEEYGINKIAENLMMGFFNIVFDCKLENMGYQKKNYPGIDLGDCNKKIAIQVTSDSSSDKIIHTLEEIKKYKLYDEYEEIYIYLLKEKKQYKNLQQKIDDVTKPDFTFSETHVIDAEDIYRKLNEENNLKKITVAAEYLEKYLSSEERKGSIRPWKIWRAGKKEFDRLHQKNNKLHSLKVSDSLLPANSSDIMQQLKDRNMILLGEGGSGKTTLLAYIIEMLYREEDCGDNLIPFYVELNKCPKEISGWYSNHFGKTNFITRYIAAELYEMDYGQLDEEKISEIEKELRKLPEDKVPQYLLLLDGFNEVCRNKTSDGDETVRGLLKREIEELAKYGNVRIVLTSRKLENLPENMESIELQKPKVEHICAYLKEAGYEGEEISRIMASPELSACLRIPLFLCMFAASKQYKNELPLTRGEILYRYFHKGNFFCSEKNNIRNAYAKASREEKLLMFIMDFILPYISSIMEKDDGFYANRSQIIKMIENFLVDEKVPFWDENIEIFREYENGEESLSDVRESVRSMKEKAVIDYMVNVLGVLTYDNKNGYSFIHQYVRDYFSCIYEMQCICSAIVIYRSQRKQGGEPSEEVLNALGAIKRRDWADKKRILMGEILGENRNAPVKDEQGRWVMPTPTTEEQSLLREVMDIFRDAKVFPGHAIDNIVEIMKLVRKNLSGECFDGLDMRDCELYKTQLSIGTGEKGLAASFRGARLSEETFGLKKVSGVYMDIQISGDERYLYTLDIADTLKIWDLENYRCIRSVALRNTFNIDICWEDRQITVGKDGGFLVKSYAYSCQEEADYEFDAWICYYTAEGDDYLPLKNDEEPSGIWDMVFSADGSSIAGVWEDNHIVIYDKEDGKIRHSFHVEDDVRVMHISMPQDNIVILHALSENLKSSNVEEKRSKWKFIKVDLTDNVQQELMEYRTVYNCKANYCGPVFAFDESGWKALVFEDRAVNLIDLKMGLRKEILHLEQNVLSKRVFFSGNYAVVHWGECCVLHSLEDDQQILYRTPMLANASKVLYKKNALLFYGGGEKVYELGQQQTDEPLAREIPTTAESMTDLYYYHEDEILYIRYSDKSVLALDVRNGELENVSGFVEIQNNGETCNIPLEINGMDRKAIKAVAVNDKIVFCIMSDDVLAKFDRESGKIVEEYKWYPDIMVIGCDFRGARADERILEILRQHGAVIEKRGESNK